METTNLKQKTSFSYGAIELLLGIIAIAIPLLHLKAGLFFILVAGLTMWPFGLALLSLGALRMAALQVRNQSSVPMKVTVATSAIAIGTALAILYFQLINPTQQWVQYLFGFGFLSYGIGRIGFGALTRRLNLGLRALAAVSGLVVALISILVVTYNHNLMFPPILLYSNLLDLCLIVIGIEGLISGTINTAYAYKGKALYRVD